MKIATYRAGALRNSFSATSSTRTTTPSAGETMTAGLRGDIPLRVPEKIGEKAAAQDPQDREPGPAPHHPQEEQHHPAQDKTIPRGRNGAALFIHRGAHLALVPKP